MNEIITLLPKASSRQSETLDSREVAAMVDKRHDHLLRDIEVYSSHIEELGNPKVEVSEFFQKSSYFSEQNKELPCYLITKQGCEMIANKLTGAKGVRFTATYVQRFNEMETKEKAGPLGDFDSLSPQLQVLINLEREQAEMKRQMSATAEKADAAVAAITAIKETVVMRDDDWRRWVNRMFNNAVQNSPGRDYQALRDETYRILEERAGCNLNQRLRNYRERLAEQGATRTAIDKANRLDCIKSDKRLKEIYTSIIKELSIRYSA